MPPVPPTASLADRLRAARQAAGRTQRDLAQVLGTAGYRAIWRLERGKRGASIEEIEQLAQVLGVSPAWLAFGQGPRDADGAAPRAREAPGRLRQAREHAGLRLARLAEAAAITEAQLSHYESGTTPLSVARAAELAALIGRSPAWLAYGVDLE